MRLTSMKLATLSAVAPGLSALMASTMAESCTGLVRLFLAESSPPEWDFDAESCAPAFCQTARHGCVRS